MPKWNKNVAAVSLLLAALLAGCSSPAGQPALAGAPALEAVTASPAPADGLSLTPANRPPAAVGVTAEAATATPVTTTPTGAPPLSYSLPSIQQIAGGLLGQAWPGSERVTVLVMGEEHCQGDTQRAYQTDTMMLISIDPAAKTITMVSIPRDLWVAIPGSGDFKINEANFIGDAYHYPGGGPALAVKTVQQNLKLKVDYYFRLDFTAFETFVDAIGGIDIVNAQAIDDAAYPDGSYGYEPFSLSAGPHHLNGHEALRYARTRHGSTDMARAGRQQEVILAVRQKVLNLNLLSSLAAQAPDLYQKLNQSITTNLTLQQMIAGCGGGNYPPGPHSERRHRLQLCAQRR